MKKCALVIGNNDYQHMNKLSCAVNDAEAIGDKLEKLGFECIKALNIDYYGMGSVLEAFQEKLKLFETGLVYFAGHGFEVDKTNYLAMVDTGIGPEGRPVKHHAYKLNDFIDIFDRSDLKVKIIILDACRDHYTDDGRGVTINGFGPVFAPKGTIIAFSTSPGQKAKEVIDTGHGRYTSALLKCIDAPRLPIEGMFKRVREIVSATSSNSQIPWEHTSLLGDFYFNPDIATGDSAAVYSDTALADSQYMFVRDSVLKDIILDLKSYYYYTQNPAINKIDGIDWNQTSVNEIFILGRNIYQAACGGAREAENYVKKLVHNLNRLPKDVGDHLLCGMAYEIYFDSNGKLRNNFKCERDYEHIEEMLYEHVENILSERKGQALMYIQNSLAKYDDRIIYIPGSYQKYIFAISTEKYQDQPRNYTVMNIFCNGQSVFYNSNGTKNADNKVWLEDTVPKRKEVFEKCVASKIIAPRDMVEYIYDTEERNFNVLIPYNNFSVRWYGK